MSARETLRAEADELDERAAVADVCAWDDPSGAIAERARMVADFRARAAALRALADRWDEEVAFLTSEIKKSGSDFAAVSLCVLDRLDADLAPPAPTPPPAMHEFQVADDRETVTATVDGKPLDQWPAPPPCASWCGTANNGECIGSRRDGTACFAARGTNVCYCTASCRDAGAPRNPVKPCETCEGSRRIVFRDGPATDSKPCPTCAKQG